MRAFKSVGNISALAILVVASTGFGAAAQTANTPPINDAQINAAVAYLDATTTARTNAARFDDLSAYFEAAQTYALLEKRVSETRAKMSSLSKPDLDLSKIDLQIVSQAAEKDRLAIELKEWQTASNATGGENPEILGHISATRKKLAAATRELKALDAQAKTIEAFNTAATTLAELRQKMEKHKFLARDALETAASTPVTIEMVRQIHRLMRLPAPQNIWIDNIRDVSGDR